MKMKSTTKMNVCVKLTVALLTAFALVAGVTQVTMAKKKAKSEVAAKASTASKTSSKKSKKTTSSSSKKKEESKISKADAAAKELVSDLTTTQKKKLLTLLNDGDTEALSAITGVGEVRAKAIIKARPFKSVEDLRQVSGVGDKVFGDVVAHGKTLTGRSSAKSAASKKSSKKKKST